MTEITARAFARQIGVPYIPREAIVGLDADTTRPARRPAAVLERAPTEWNGPGIEIDRFDPNPALSFYKALLPGFRFVGQPPSMFSSGPTPLFTGSGIDVDLLYFVPWQIRHGAALTPDRHFALRCIEEGSDGMTLDLLQTREGQHALRVYVARVQAWAMTSPPPIPLTEADIARLYPPNRPPPRTKTQRRSAASDDDVTARDMWRP